MERVQILVLTHTPPRPIFIVVSRLWCWNTRYHVTKKKSRWSPLPHCPPQYEGMPVADHQGRPTLCPVNRKRPTKKGTYTCNLVVVESVVVFLGR